MGSNDRAMITLCMCHQELIPVRMLFYSQPYCIEFHKGFQIKWDFLDWNNYPKKYDNVGLIKHLSVNRIRLVRSRMTMEREQDGSIKNAARK